MFFRSPKVNPCSQVRILSSLRLEDGRHTIIHHAFFPCQRKKSKRYVCKTGVIEYSYSNDTCLISLFILLQSLSPERLKTRPTAQNQQSRKNASPSSVRDENVAYTEIWPSSEWHLSPSSTTASDRLSPELGVQQEPVLAKYVNFQTILFSKCLNQ